MPYKLIFSKLVFLLYLEAASAQTNEKEVVDCIQSILVLREFDRCFYVHPKVKVVDSITFFVLREGIIEEKIPLTMERSRNVIKFDNRLISFSPKELLFVWDVEYFLKFKEITFEGTVALIIVEQIYFDGFRETVLNTTEYRLVKNNTNDTFLVDSKKEVKAKKNH